MNRRNERKEHGLRTIAASLGLCVLVVPVPVASAPSNGDDPPLVSSGLVSVPQVEGRGWTLDASVNTQYNSNFRRSINSGGVWRVTPQVTAGIGMPVGRQQIFIGGFLGRDVFLNNSRFNRNRMRIGGGINVRAGTNCVGSVAGEIGRFQTLFGDVAVVEDNVQQQRSLGAQVNCQGDAGLGFGGTVQYQETENSRARRQLFNFESLSISPQVSYASPTIGVFSLGASFQNVKYPQRLVLGPDGVVGDEVNIRSGRLGYRRNLGSRLDLNMGVSSLRVAPKPASVVVLLPGVLPEDEGFVAGVITDRQPFSALGYDGALSLQLGDRIDITASTSRSARPNANLGALTTIRTAHGIDVDYKLNRKISASVGGSLVNARYRSSFASPDEPQRRISDRISRVYGQVRFVPRRGFSMGLEVAHQDRQSNPSIFSFSNTTAMLRLSASMGRTR
jgi:hypothetical protein